LMTWREKKNFQTVFIETVYNLNFMDGLVKTVSKFIDGLVKTVHKIIWE
jgi:hypothetical protein